MSDNFKVATWKKGIKLTDLKKGDLIYVRRMKSGYMVTLECDFISYEKGLVTVKNRSKPNPYWYQTDFPVGMILRVRQSQCYLWGGGEENNLLMRDYCHWCKGGEFK